MENKTTSKGLTDEEIDEILYTPELRFFFQTVIDFNPTTQEDWKFIFDCLERAKGGLYRGNH